MRENYVNLPPSGLIIGLQLWSGDEAQALRLARLLADIEPARRSDVTLMFCRRFDTPVSGDFWQTFLHCGMKFPVGQITSRRQATGHPDGSYGLFAGTMDQLSAAWRSGNLNAASVFMVEADGVPLRRDWLDRLIAEHALALGTGKRVTGDRIGSGSLDHINGSMILNLPLWFDRLSLHETPAGQAFDLFHASTFIAECRPTRLMLNLYGSTDWSDSALAGVGRYAAWGLNVKDTSALAWAERTLVDRPAKVDPYRPEARVHEHFGPCGIGLGCYRCGAGADVPCDLTALGHQPAKLGTEEATPAPRRVTVRG